MKTIKKIYIFMFIAIAWLSCLTTSASVADNFTIPAADKNARVGALMPYVRYDSPNAAIGGGANLKQSTNMDRSNVASQASDQSYVDLPGNGAYAEWTMHSTGRGVTMRFTMPDSNDGVGLNGSLDVYVNGVKTQTVNLRSYWMWQYFTSGNPQDSPGGIGCFAFDEVHFLLNKRLNSGDKIRIQSSGANGLDYGVDFLEIEEVPDAIEQPDNSVSVTDFGAVADDGNDDLSAFVKAVAAADKGGKIVYIPEGTWNLSGMWNIYCSGVKITGAGMWYTNIQFTSDKAFGGGISGGNGSNGGTDDYCKNLEFCNMHINSNLRSRYNQQAVYKCFMDIFADGSCIHDIWEEHFECGFWFGDYNGAMGYCDGVKVVNCRIRNNLADGVNFCQGTSNATVYNCSIRNNGDDGLACWNNSYMSAKDEQNNVFAYNTIDFVWRAGGIALYGGNGFKIYNNYLRDMFMAAGIHLNSTFDGYKFQNTQNISFDNNILVHCGTSADSWNEDMGAVDLKQSVKNITFNNTQIYNSPFDAIRVLSDPTSITFNNTKILGTGLTGEPISYSCVNHTCGAVRLQNQNVTFNGIEIGGYLTDKVGNNTTFPIWTDNNQTMKDNMNATYLGSDVNYTTPDYPTADNSSQGGGVIDPLDGVTGYDVQLQGLTWTNQSGSTTIKEGDKVTFTALIKNATSVDIPAKAKISLKVVVDGTTTLNLTMRDGLKAGASVKLSPTVTWESVAGGHEIVATVDPQNELPSETDENNNVRTKKFNVQANAAGASFTPVTGGYDLVITGITYGQSKIAVGDKLVFSANVVNAGDRDVPAGTKIGLQFQVDGQTYGSGHITWCDTFKSGLKSHESATLTCNGGGGSDGTNYNYWTATTGDHSVMGWIDDQNLFSEVNENNNTTTIELSIPYAGILYIENPDSPDDLDNPGGEVVNPDQPDDDTVETIVLDADIMDFCSSQTLDFSQVSGIKAYIVTGYFDDSDQPYVSFERVNVVPAGTGVILRGTSGATYKVAKSTTKSFYANFLQGVLSDVVLSSSTDGYYNYVLQNGQFYLADNNSVSSKSAYLRLPTNAVSGVNYASAVFNDETTDILVRVVNQPSDDIYYNLSGQKVSKPHNGIFIHNGKKMIIRK